jgi:pimeloyl-[acyl-carrier protein] synthase
MQTATAKPLETTGKPLNILAPENLRNPYPMFQYLLAEEPVFFDENSKLYVVSRNSDIEMLLKDPRLSADRYTALAAETPESEKSMNKVIVRYLSMFLLNLEGEKHARLRSFTIKSFLPRHMEILGPLALASADELVAKIKEKGQMEVIADIAFPMPVRFICQMLGLPNPDTMLIKELSDYVSIYIGSAGRAPGCIPLAHRGFTELADLFWPVVKERRQTLEENAQRDDLVSSMMSARVNGEALTDEEVVANCILFLVSGFETTTNLIAGGMLALLEHPEQMEMLRKDPSLIDGAVEEILRYYPSVNRTARLLVDDVELHGKTLLKGSIVILMLGAGNRDPRVFTNPDKFDIARPREGKLLSFGAGIHFCTGSHLARLQGKIAISTLLRELPDLKCDTTAIKWRGDSRFRGLEALNIAF